MPDFQPLHNAHAIEQVAFSVTFQTPLDDLGLQAARTAIGNPAELPGRMELRQFAMQVGGAAGPLSAPTLSNGHAYTRIRPDGVTESELHLLRNAVQFRTLLYTRWAAVWEIVSGYFSRLLPIYGRAPLTQVTLNYLDKFVCAAPVEEARVASILKEDSPYIAPRIYQATDLWHCHSGTFGRINERTKRLLSANLDYITEMVQPENRERQALAITTAVADLFNQPGYTALQLAPEAVMPIVEASFQQLHEVAKMVLRSIISNDMARRIALEA